MIRVLFHDAFLIVIEKPAGLLSVPGAASIHAPAASNQLLSQLTKLHADTFPAAFTHARGTVETHFPRNAASHVVHRLDAATSGLMIFPRSRAAMGQLARGFAQGRIGKVYEALVDARSAGFGSGSGAESRSARTLLGAAVFDDPSPHPHVINLPLGKRAGVPLLHTSDQSLCAVPLRQSSSSFKILSNGCGGAIRVEFYPSTGRTHQLRLHAAEGLGAPIIGDALYGTGCGEESWASVSLVPRAAAKCAAGLIVPPELVTAIEEARARERTAALHPPATLLPGGPPLQQRLHLHARELIVPDEKNERWGTGKRCESNAWELDVPAAAVLAAAITTPGFAVLPELCHRTGARRVRFVLQCPF